MKAAKVAKVAQPRLVGFFKTREMAYVMAVDQARLALHPYRLPRPWTDEFHDRVCEEFRRLWTLDEDFTEREFKQIHGRRPEPLSESDWLACRSIHQAQLAERGGVLLGMAPIDPVGLSAAPGERA